MSRVAALVLSAAVLSGCGVGLHAQTYQEKGRGDGTSVDLRSILIRNLHVEAPASGNQLAAGSDAVLTGSIINRGQTADTLTSVTTDAATTVRLDNFSGGAGFHPPEGVPIAIPAGGAQNEWSATLTGLTKAVRAGE